MRHVLAEGGYRNVRLHSSDVGEGRHNGDVHHPHPPDSALEGIHLEMKRKTGHRSDGGRLARGAMDPLDLGLFQRESLSIFQADQEEEKWDQHGRAHHLAVSLHRLARSRCARSSIARSQLHPQVVQRESARCRTHRGPLQVTDRLINRSKR